MMVGSAVEMMVESRAQRKEERHRPGNRAQKRHSRVGILGLNSIVKWKTTAVGGAAGACKKVRMS